MSYRRLKQWMGDRNAEHAPPVRCACSKQCTTTLFSHSAITAIMNATSTAGDVSTWLPQTPFKIAFKQSATSPTYIV
jgi:hypothetical protein